MAESSKKRHLLLAARIAAFFGVALALAVFGALAYLNVAPGKIARGVAVGDLMLGGLDETQAAMALAARYQGMTLTFVVDGQQAVLHPAEHDISDGGFVTFDPAETAKAAAAIGSGNGVRAVFDRALAATVGVDEEDFIKYDFRPTELRAQIQAALEGKIAEAQDARLVVRIGRNDQPEISIEPQNDGTLVNYEVAARETMTRLATLSSESVMVPSGQAAAKITVTDVEPLRDGVKGALDRAPVRLTARDKVWSVSRSLLADWLAAVPTEGTPRLGLDPEKVTRYLDARTADLESGPQDAEFEMKDGKVTKFVPGEDGQKLDPVDSLIQLEKAVFGPDDLTEPLALSMILSEPNITTGESNNLGIKEVVGWGGSNFAGSPKNRRHNIAVGAKAVNNTLIPAGEEFSMLKTLGTIDGTTGYLEELVIKGNKTTPEFGGGLCQIGSTAFRGALDSGLPITKRQNHSYRVTYYEKDIDGKYIGPGKDATIYDPQPDFKFKNDTGHAILITTSIVGDKLKFTFWGTKDGRKSEQTTARVYNLVDPPEKKLIETVDLKPGEEKCTEKPHPGSDAVFTYTVTMGDGTVRKEDVKSHYRPWQEVCLIGVDQATFDAHAAATAAAAAGTPTPADLPSQDATGAQGN